MRSDRYSHYRILEDIGAGGMGAVYRAHDEHLHRDVAIKVLHTGVLADEDERRRFRREALALAKLNHPYIATIHELGNQDGLDFLVMEYVPGVSLADRLESGPLPPAEVMRLGVQIAAALEEAHQHGVLHRDLKPHNIRVTPKGDVKLLDFGLARLLHSVPDDAMTQTVTGAGLIAGTVPYMSPEQLRGEAGDARADVWALGAVLYELATARRPFEGSSVAELMSAILRDESVPLPSHVPQALAAIIQRCLRKDPLQRYQRASEVQAALDAAGASAGRVAATAPELLKLWRHRTALGGFAILSVLVVGLLLWMHFRGAPGEANTPSPVPRIAAIAVLPLQNLSGDASQEYFADGMTEALTLELSKVAALKVPSRTSAMRFKGSQRALRDIAADLGVDALVEGSVARSGNRVRVTAQLIHAATDQHVWSDQYDRELTDILTLQSEAARAIVDRIRVQLTPEERERLSRKRPVNPAAYDAYVLGRFHLTKRDRESIRKAVEQFDKAVAIDPDYAQAWAGLARAYVDGEIFGGFRFRDAAHQIRGAAERALQLDENLAESHALMSVIHFNYDWDWSAGVAEHKRALELNPNSADSHSAYAYYLQAMKRDEEALASVRRAVALDPLSPGHVSDEGRVLYRMRRYDDAILRYRRALDLEPGFVVALSRLVDAYREAGRYAQAADALKQLEQRADGLRNVMQRGMLAAAMKKRREAVAMADLLDENTIQAAYVRPVIYGKLGDRDTAFRYLERAVHDRAMLPFHLQDPAFDSIRSDPRFGILLRRMGLPE